MCDILDVAYNSLALYNILTTKLNVEELARQANFANQNDMLFLQQLVYQIQNELFDLIRALIQSY